MTTETMNVHKALCELKILGSRIGAAMGSVRYCYENKHANAKVNGVDIDKKNEEVKSVYQQVRDLMARRDAIKRAVILSNATTKVSINGKEYTVAEAIDMKNAGVAWRRELLNKLCGDLKMAQMNTMRMNADLEERADNYIKSFVGNSDLKTGMTAELKKVRDEFIEQQTCEIIDPICIQKEIDSISKEIDGFMVEIDSALSVSNATTNVTFSY